MAKTVFSWNFLYKITTLHVIYILKWIPLPSMRGSQSKKVVKVPVSEQNKHIQHWKSPLVNRTNTYSIHLSINQTAMVRNQQVLAEWLSQPSTARWLIIARSSKGKVFYGQEPPSGEFTTTGCGFNYQLLAVIYWSSPMGSSQLHSTTTSYGQWRRKR